MTTQPLTDTDPYAPDTIGIGDTVEWTDDEGRTWEAVVSKIYPKARRFRLRGHFGEYGSFTADPRVRAIEAPFERVQLIARCA